MKILKNEKFAEMKLTEKEMFLLQAHFIISKVYTTISSKINFIDKCQLGKGEMF